MGAWPTDDLTNTYLDSANDDPALARAELNNLLLKAKAIIAAYDHSSGVAPLNSSGVIPGDKPRVKIAHGYITSAGALSKGPSGWSASRPITGHYLLTHNLGHTRWTAQATDYNTGTAITIGATQESSNQCRFKVYKYDNTLINYDFMWMILWSDADSYTFP